MTGQLESKHFFRAGDQVRAADGRAGRVTEAWTLYAAIEWDDGGQEEVEQFNESVFVEQRAQ